MLMEILVAIFPKKTTGTFGTPRRPYSNRANFKKRRSKQNLDNDNDKTAQLKENLDDTQAYKVKNHLSATVKKIKLPRVFSVFIFYVCVVNVIISCDVSINNVNQKMDKELRESSMTNSFKGEKLKLHHNFTKFKIGGKNLRKGRAPLHEETEEQKPDKYSPGRVQDVTKYYNYYKNKEEFINSTEYPKNLLILSKIYDDIRAVGYPHDLARSPYFVKRTNFNLRPERHQFKNKIVKFGVLLSADPTQVFSLAKVLPIVEMAAAAVTKQDGPLPGWKILVDYRDTRCSSVDGPLAAFEFYINDSADAFIGPGCEYVIAPVARYAGPWRIPVLTAGAQAEAFGYKNPGYQTLTRMMGSYTQAGVAIRKVFEEFNWRKLGMLYHNNNPATGQGNSPCYLTLSAVFSVLLKKNTGSSIPNIPFDETVTNTTVIKQLLKKLSLSTRSEYDENEITGVTGHDMSQCDE